ncbi:MAG: pyridoxal phosphate-dependent aminotransferase [Planctomycetaceae bacterium]|jgi:putative C-S lyase|nr:pyridoxal phosphate-dependent aminotransferase [Planctomycetaceae bacterium]
MTNQYDFDTIVDRRTSGNSYKWEGMKSAMKENAGNVLAVSTADMDFLTATKIVERLRESARREIFGYTCPTNEYYDAIVNWMQRRHQWRIEKESIALAPGIVSALTYLIHALTEPGDGIVIQPPVYPPFARTIRVLGREQISNPLVNANGCYSIDFDDLEQKAARKNAKLMILCSPHNPVGRVWLRAELEQVADICLRHDVFIISDEIHFDIVFPPHRHTVFPTLDRDLQNRCVVCTSPSKSFNIAGLQVSNIVIPNREIRQKYVDAALYCGFNALNTLAFPACIAAYNECEDWFDKALKYIRQNDQLVRDVLGQRLPNVVISPLQATYLQWLDFSRLGFDALTLRQFLREKAGVFFDDGFLFGDEGKQFERFNLAYPRAVIEEVVRRVAKAANCK